MDEVVTVLTDVRCDRGRDLVGKLDPEAVIEHLPRAGEFHILMIRQKGFGEVPEFRGSTCLPREHRGEHVPPQIGRHVLAGLMRSEEHTSELQSLMRIPYAVFCLKKNNK